MKKVFWGIAAAAIVIAAGVWGTRQQHAEPEVQSAKPVVKIGFVGPLSGDNAVMGQNCRRGLEMALDKLVNGSFNYKVIYEDDQFKAARSAAAVSKLIHVDQVDVVYACSAVTGAAIVTQTKQNKKIQMTVCSSSEETALASPYSFIHWTPPYKEGEKALEWFKKNKVKKLVMITEVHPGAKALSDAVQKAAETAGIETKVIWVQSNERNYTDIVQKAVTENGDMWFLTLLQPGIDIFGKKMVEQRIEIPFSSAEIPSLMNNKKMFEKVVYVDVYDGNPKLLEEYRKKYKTENVYAFAFSYDAMMIINHIYNNFYHKNNKLPNSMEFATEIQSLNGYTGAVGPVKVLESGFLETEAVLKKIVNGKPVVVEE